MNSSLSTGIYYTDTVVSVNIPSGGYIPLSFDLVPSCTTDIQHSPPDSTIVLKKGRYFISYMGSIANTVEGQGIILKLMKDGELVPGSRIVDSTVTSSDEVGKRANISGSIIVELEEEKSNLQFQLISRQTGQSFNVFEFTVNILEVTC
ncbi:hypothetical protein II5_00478 [Bacillus cereus MSX-A1]|uniref:hypothetical protein n=1 Tax=Bacillus cereus TaxID=1396 RepID=UPI000279738D|nr:hypothetical protein [Bacillus cereus]EJR09175.1 hypothetical protein II5_00478 [Bacillus cereus MSX-A1]MDR4289258.1 hypothetical protein [Bacillus cereus]